MQGYRDATSPIPLVTFVGRRVVALDPETGALRWQRSMEPHAISRVLVAGPSLFLATFDDLRHTGAVFVLDLATGADRASFQTDFAIKSALVAGDRLYFAGDRGFLALSTGGGFLFRLRVETTSKSRFGVVTESYVLIGVDGTGADTWRIPDAGIYGKAFIAMGDLVSQPDPQNV